MPFLQTTSLSIGYGQKCLIADINVSLRRGEITALIGRNGSGKSTLIKTLTKTLKTLSGSVKVEDRELGTYNRRALSRLMAVVNTEPDMAGGLRVHELVALGRIPYTGKMGTLSDRDKEIVERSMRVCGIYHKRDNFVGELSDGERQKGMIARGLAQDTPLLIMDEPFSYLDVAARIEMLKLLNTLAREENKAVLFSSHDVGKTLRAASRVWLIGRWGKTDKDEIREGTPEELIDRGLMNGMFPENKVRFNDEIRDFE